MKVHTGKNKSGAYYKGFSSYSCVPNHKPKRARQSHSVETSIDNLRVKVRINMFGIIGAIVTAMEAPLTMEWKIGMMVLFLLSAVHMEVIKDE